MSEITVDVAAINRETIKKSLETFMKVAKGISTITPTAMDDKLVNILSQFATEDWFVELVEMIVNLFDKDEEQAKAAIASVVASLKAA